MYSRPMALQQKFYESLIRPHIKYNPDGETLLYLYDQAFRAWTLHVGKEEIENMLIVQRLCKKLGEKHEEIIITLISTLWNKLHDKRKM